MQKAPILRMGARLTKKNGLPEGERKKKPLKKKFGHKINKTRFTKLWAGHFSKTRII